MRLQTEACNDQTHHFFFLLEKKKKHSPYFLKLTFQTIFKDLEEHSHFRSYLGKILN